MIFYLVVHADTNIRDLNEIEIRLSNETFYTELADALERINFLNESGFDRKVLKVNLGLETIDAEAMRAVQINSLITAKQNAQKRVAGATKELSDIQNQLLNLGYSA